MYCFVQCCIVLYCTVFPVCSAVHHEKCRKNYVQCAVRFGSILLRRKLRFDSIRFDSEVLTRSARSDSVRFVCDVSVIRFDSMRSQLDSIRSDLCAATSCLDSIRSDSCAVKSCVDSIRFVVVTDCERLRRSSAGLCANESKHAQ